MWVRIRNWEWVSKWAVSTLLTEYWVTSGGTLIKHVALVMHFLWFISSSGEGFCSEFQRCLLPLCCDDLITMCWWIGGPAGKCPTWRTCWLPKKAWGAKRSPAPLLYSQLPPLPQPWSSNISIFPSLFCGTGSSCVFSSKSGPLRMTGGPWIKHRLVCFVPFWANDVLVMKYFQFVTFAY